MSREIKSIGIIGEGKMGTNLFYYLMEFGFSIVWLVSENADIDKLQKSFQKKVKRSFETGLINTDRKEFLIRNMIITKELTNLATCDLIIEAISENKDHKKDFFTKIDAIVNPNSIFTSNSSSINPSELIPSVTRQPQFAGLHFFYPVQLKNIVELIITDTTSEETKTRLIEFLEKINRNYLTLKEECSFILNRIFLDLQNEAYHLGSSGEISFSQMDQLVKNHFCSSGVFEFCDHVGNDIMLESVKNYTKYRPDAENYKSFMSLLEKLVSEKKFGIKSGQGFYHYENGTSTATLNNDKNISGVQSEMVHRLRLALQYSIINWSAQSKISLSILYNVMKEYLGTETELFEN
jgi:3-hydroxybutyryl-CoA dehydrogenase